MAMFLIELMMYLIVILVCLALIAACGWVIIESYKYLKKTFNWGNKKKVLKTSI